MVSHTGSFVEAEPANSYRQLLPLLSHQHTAFLITAFMFILVVYRTHGSNKKLHRWNPTKTFELTTRRVQEEFMTRGLEMLVQARKTYGKQPYRLYSDIGDVIVFPGEIMQEIRNHSALSFMEGANYVRAICCSRPNTAL